MRTNAKRPTAGSSQRRARGLGRVFRGSFATRGASSGERKGSGAPSHRGRRGVLALAAAVLATAVVASSAFASKEVIDFFGTVEPSPVGGKFGGPLDVAVNNTGAGPADPGDIYVAEVENQRVQRLDSEGNFISAWGADVALPDGGTDYEICTEASQCQQGAGGSGNGTAAGNGVLDRPNSIAVDDDTGNVYVSDRNTRRINAYDGEGNFLFSVGRDVAEPNGGTEVEICDGETDVCRVGDAGSGPGQIGGEAQGIAVSPPDGEASSGAIYLADTQNRRINTYALDGTSLGSFGSAANFGVGEPRKVAVDSRGVVYASDNQNGAEVERYDSEDANGGGIGFLTPIPADIDEAQVVTINGWSSGGIDIRLTCPDGSETDDIFVFNPGAWENLDPTLEAECGQGGGEDFDTTGSVGVTATVTFSGAYATTDVPTMSCTVISGPASGCSVSTVIEASDAGVLLPGNAESTIDLAVDPDTDGAGADEDVLHVLRDPRSGSTVVQQFGPIEDPGLAPPPTAADDTHGDKAGLTRFINGLGLSELTDQIFWSARSTISGGVGHRIFVLGDPLPDPVATLGPIAAKTDTTATFSGTVDPKGGSVTCRYEYSEDPGFGAPLGEVPEPECSELARGGGAQAVSEEATGLDPNTQYFVRLRVSRALDPSLTSVSGPQTFTTDAPPPVVSDVGAVQITNTSARLVGTIDPENNDTGYVFEYGTSPALGSSTSPLGIGGGTEEITVSRLVDGLKPATTYYLRLVATNLSGTTTGTIVTFRTRTDPLPPAGPGNCPNAERRAEQGTTHLPACRAYEMVSPPDKNQGSALLGFEYAAFSRDGTGAAFCSSTIFGEPPSQQTFTCAPNLSRRGTNGWTTSPPGPRYCNVDPDSTDVGGSALQAFLSPRGFDRVAANVPDYASCPFQPGGGLSPQPNINLYVEDLTTEPAGRDLLTPEPDVVGGSTEPTARFQAGNDDYSHYVYKSQSNQTPDSPPQGAYEKLYDWERQGTGDCVTPGGCLSLISIKPDGSPFTTASGLTVGEQRANSSIVSSAVADDGERIFFQNPVNPGGFGGGCLAGCEVYLRENGATTVHVSASECTEECGAASTADAFVWANPDGDKALLLSCAKLTDASAPTQPCSQPDRPFPNADLKLYRWDRDAPPGSRLTDLTIDQEPADGVQPKAMGVIGASVDGEVVFFVAKGQLLAGGPLGPVTAGQPVGPDHKLYRWRFNGGSPEVDYLAPYRASVSEGPPVPGANVKGDPNLNRLHVRATPDGEYLVISTPLPLDPAGDRDSDMDLYRWHEDTGWICVSCQLPGLPSAGAAGAHQVALLPGLTNTLGSFEPEHTISDDGQRVFFATPDALLAQDINGEAGCPFTQISQGIDNGGRYYDCQDIYEWHDGTLSLITPGTGNHPYLLMGATKTGDEVFLFTRERLVGWDQDNGTDVYVAKTNGGFPEPAPQPPECEGEGCRGEGSDAPEIVGAGSAVFQGPGNPKATSQGKRRCPANRLRRGKRCLTVGQLARKRCRRLEGTAKRRCVRRQARRLRRAQRRRAQRRNKARANAYRRAAR